MLCRRCGHNHLTTLEELDCASGKRTKIGSSQGKGRVEIVDPGANGSEVSEPPRAENQESGKTAASDSMATFDRGSITMGSVTSSVTKQERWRQKNLDRYRRQRAAYMREYRKRS